MKALHVRLSPSLWKALEAEQNASGQPIPHIVRTALASYLQLEHATLFQVSTSRALVEGIYAGAVSIGELRKHGDFGLGTFEGLDGEMIAVDGRFYQVKSDGTVGKANDRELSPFAVVTFFTPEQTIEIDECRDLSALSVQLNKLRVSNNYFYAIRVDAQFRNMHTRAMCRSEEGTPLVVAAAHQPEFRISNVIGTLAGIWSPEYVKAIEIPGYHLHFITADRSAGGHVLGLSACKMQVRIQRLHELRIALPENQDFLRADLSGDSTAALIQAETASSRRLR
jgi:acetolactate decarboxylase